MLLGGKPPPDDRLPDGFGVHAAPVIGDGNTKPPRMMAGRDLEATRGRFAGGQSFGGRLQPMVESIANKVRKRPLEAIDHVAIHLGILSLDDEIDLFAQVAGEVAHETTQRPRHIAKRTHPAGKGLAVNTAAELQQAAVMEVATLALLGRQRLAGKRAPRPAAATAAGAE